MKRKDREACTASSAPAPTEKRSLGDKISIDSSFPFR